ncbi:uncharacterized protein [Watersipora subatra]|uniref:uncharacterized protein n=1 Tax=Watersipora subatra TaxID=2589382 RepID=UPI00355B5327
MACYSPFRRTWSYFKKIEYQTLYSHRKASVFQQFSSNPDGPPKGDNSDLPTEQVYDYEEQILEALPKYYTPPDNVEGKVIALAKQLTSSPSEIETTTKMTDNLFKYKVLTACVKEFQFDIPSCELGELQTLSDVVNFYSFARNITTPEERLKSADLPKNVHLELEPLRFTEQTKHQFGGKTAFPERDTIVKSLKYRDVYEGYKNEKVYKKKDGFNYY